MNVGISRSCGQVVMKVDAHSTYPHDYIEACVRYLFTHTAKMVEGVGAIAPRAQPSWPNRSPSPSLTDSLRAMPTSRSARPSPDLGGFGRVRMLEAGNPGGTRGLR